MNFVFFLLLFGITLVFSLIVASFYYKKFQKRDLAISIVIYSQLIFSIVYFVSFESNIGLGIGLLGILSLIRLRSNLESLIDIAFVFYAISIGLINASVSDITTSLFIDAILTALLLVMPLVFKREVLSMGIVFDDIPEDLSTESLREDIKKRYNINPLSIQIVKIDNLKETIRMDITYEKLAD
ncbi:MAG: DUF4956 domain-containing protein [Candidatus Gracilibacteria bacterium]|jgi:hypothetical protein|nr:DUF4956 domain-containing protein [Candidatus Gracilibacteria bacterium]